MHIKINLIGVLFIKQNHILLQVLMIKISNYGSIMIIKLGNMILYQVILIMFVVQNFIQKDKLLFQILKIIQLEYGILLVVNKLVFMKINTLIVIG